MMGSKHLLIAQFSSEIPKVQEPMSEKQKQTTLCPSQTENFI